MTIEEIIDLLKKDKAQRGDCLISDAIDIVVKMLEQEPFINKACVSTNACKHDKEVALNKIKAEIKHHSELFINEFGEKSLAIYEDDVIEIIDKYIRSDRRMIKHVGYVELKQKQERERHWIDNHNGTISCSSCQTWFHKDDRYSYMRFCPYCRAKMEESEDEK